MYKIVKPYRNHKIGELIEPNENDLKFLLENGVVVEEKKRKSKSKG